MSILPVLLALLVSPPVGHWEGAFSRDGAIQGISVDLAVTDGKLSGTYDMPELGLVDEPLEQVSWNPPELSIKVRYGTFAMIVHPDVDEMTGVNAKWGPPVRLHLKRTLPDTRPKVPRDDVQFRNGQVTLAGTLFKPFAPGPWPVVVVVQGSGAQGRKSATYASWGRFFAERGIAALVYDKRGVGASTGNWEKSTFDDLAGDAAAAVELVAGRKDIDRSRICLMGISQGGWVAPLALTKTRNVSSLILDVGPAVTVEQQELDRVEFTMRDNEQTDADIAEALAYTRAVFDVAYRGASLDKLVADGKPLRSKAWAEYVQFVDSEADLEGWRLSRYDPAPVLRKTKIPVLSIFGENDVLVPPARNQALMEQYLKEAGNTDVTIRVIPRAGHDMETRRTLEGGDWAWPEKFWVWNRRSPVFYETILAWLDRRFAADSR